MTSQAFKYITKLQNARVLILGGTSGIGFSVAEAALEYGARVVVSGSNQGRLDNAISRLHSVLSRGSPLLSNLETDMVTGKTCDLGDATNLEANIESLLKFATANGADKLDHVVFTAGDALSIKSVAEASVEYIQRTSLIRFTAPVLVAKYLPKYMNSDVTSSYTLTSGTNASRPTPKWTVMTGIGSGIEGLGRGLAMDLKPIRVNVVAPGAVKTELWGDIPADRIDSVVEKFKKQSLTDTVGTPEECAEAYLYCMRDSFTTGTVLPCDGGRLIV